jgi:hypothetical protein
MLTLDFRITAGGWIELARTKTDSVSDSMPFPSTSAWNCHSLARRELGAVFLSALATSSIHEDIPFFLSLRPDASGRIAVGILEMIPYLLL